MLWSTVILSALLVATQQTGVLCKYVEGHLKTHDDWAFVARFCFLSGRGRYEYHIEYEKRMGTPQLLLYYDDESQWPSVYKTGKSCLQKVSVLSPIDNQVVTLTTKRPESYLSGCRLTTSRERHRPPAVPDKNTSKTPEDANLNGSQTASTASDEADSSYYEQFLKSTTTASGYTTTPTVTSNPLSTTELSGEFEGSGSSAYEAVFLETDADVFNATADEFFLLARDNNDGLLNGNRLENDTSFKDEVEELFSESSTENNVRVRRSVPLLGRENTGTIIVSCSNAGGFTSVRERWWYIAVGNCGSDKGIDIKYRFRMTNGPPGDFWHEHFSADEMYIPPILLVECIIYTVLLFAIFLCAIELKTGHSKKYKNLEESSTVSSTDDLSSKEKKLEDHVTNESVRSASDHEEAMTKRHWKKKLIKNRSKSKDSID